MSTKTKKMMKKKSKAPKPAKAPKSAPLAVGGETRYKRTGGFTDSLTVRGQLFLQSIKAPASPASGDILYRQYLTPGMKLPSPLVAYMGIYDKYEFLRVKFVYKGAVAATTDGALFGWADHNALAPAPAAEVLGEVCTAHKGANDFKVWSDSSFSFSRPPSADKQYYCKPSANPLDYAQAIVTVATPTVLTANKVYGNLYMEYEIRFFDPQLDVDLSNGIVNDAQNTTVQMPAMNASGAWISRLAGLSTSSLTQLAGKVSLKSVIDPIIGALASSFAIPQGQWFGQFLQTTYWPAPGTGGGAPYFNNTISVSDDAGEPLPDTAVFVDDHVLYNNDSYGPTPGAWITYNGETSFWIDTPTPANVSFATQENGLSAGPATSPSTLSARELRLTPVSAGLFTTIMAGAAARAARATVSRKGKVSYSANPDCHIVTCRSHVEAVKALSAKRLETARPTPKSEPSPSLIVSSPVCDCDRSELQIDGGTVGGPRASLRAIADGRRIYDPRCMKCEGRL